MTDKHINSLISILYYIIISTICGTIVFGIYTLSTDFMTNYYINKANILELEQNLKIKAIEAAESLKQAMTISENVTTPSKTVTIWEGWWKPLIVYFGTYAIKIATGLALKYAVQYLGNLAIIGPILKILFGVFSDSPDFVTNAQFEERCYEVIRSGRNLELQVYINKDNIVRIAENLDIIAKLTSEESNRNRIQLLEQLNGNGNLQGSGSNVPISDSSRMFD